MTGNVSNILSGMQGYFWRTIQIIIIKSGTSILGQSSGFFICGKSFSNTLQTAIEYEINLGILLLIIFAPVPHCIHDGLQTVAKLS